MTKPSSGQPRDTAEVLFSALLEAFADLPLREGVAVLWEDAQKLDPAFGLHLPGMIRRHCSQVTGVGFFDLRSRRQEGREAKVGNHRWARGGEGGK